MGSWEAVTRATQTGNMMEKEHECDLDRVAALGFVPKLGATYLRWQAGHDRQDRLALEVEMIRKMLPLARARKWKGPVQVFYSMVVLILDELEKPLCPTCGGRSMLGVDRQNAQPDDGPARVCPECNGARKRKFTPTMRASALKVSVPEWNAIWGDRFDAIRALLFRACGVTRVELDKQLAREE